VKSLVVYYSRTGNARYVAQTIASQLGAEIEEIVDLKKRSGVLGWLGGGRDARQGKETEISPSIKSPANYDLIVVGSPIWASKPTPAIVTYLKKNDLSGKKVAVFFTQGGKKPQGVEEIKALIPNSMFEGELALTNPSKSKAESEQRIVEWCKTFTAC
jgi:flavodoxin